jgi:hypothetical protein
MICRTRATTRHLERRTRSILRRAEPSQVISFPISSYHVLPPLLPLIAAAASKCEVLLVLDAAVLFFVPVPYLPFRDVCCCTYFWTCNERDTFCDRTDRDLRPATSMHRDRDDAILPALLLCFPLLLPYCLLLLPTSTLLPLRSLIDATPAACHCARAVDVYAARLLCCFFVRGQTGTDYAT